MGLQSSIAAPRTQGTTSARGPAASLAAILLCAVALSTPADAHDIPADARLNAFVKPAGTTLELLIRVPLVAMREVEFPTRGSNLLDLARAEPALRYAARVWLVDNLDLYEDDVRLGEPRIAAVRVSQPADRSFASYEQARALLASPPLAADLDLAWDQQLLDVLLEYPIRSDRSQFSIQPRIELLALRTSMALRFLPPGGVVRAFELRGDPGLVRLDPSWHQAALSFVVSGFWHILEGTDHLLFLFCLVIPFRRLRPLVIIVTSFTVAHSISLIASAFGFVPDAPWFPPLVETLIAVTILYMALENIIGSNIERRWIIGFAFGLVHGFGFSFALRESLQFAGDHLVASLLAFNVGVEIGQLAVLLVLIPVLTLLFAKAVDERLGVIVLSALAAHTAWHWMLERGEVLGKFPFPRLDAAFWASAIRGLIAVLILAAVVWMADGVIKRWIAGKDVPPTPRRDEPPDPPR